MSTKLTIAIHRQIVQRIRKDIPELNSRDTMSLMMDLESVPELDTLKLLEALKFDFAHDICGIVRHMDRSTWKLTGCFVPRCSRPRSEVVPASPKGRWD